MVMSNQIKKNIRSGSYRIKFTGSVESMPISLLKVGPYYRNDSLSFNCFLKFPEMFKRDLNLACRGFGHLSVLLYCRCTLLQVPKGLCYHSHSYSCYYFFSYHYHINPRILCTNSRSKSQEVSYRQVQVESQKLGCSP